VVLAVQAALVAAAAVVVVVTERILVTLETLVV
jgi:hypothetical protein